MCSTPLSRLPRGPQGSTLSSFKIPDPDPRDGSVPNVLQAALPYLVSLAILAACLLYLGMPRERGFVWLNIVLTGVLFPLADISFGVTAYWFADNDFYYIFGSGSLTARVVLSFWVAVLAVLSFWIVGRASRARLSHAEEA